MVLKNKTLGRCFFLLFVVSLGHVCTLSAKRNPDTDNSPSAQDLKLKSPYLDPHLDAIPLDQYQKALDKLKYHKGIFPSPTTRDLINDFVFVLSKKAKKDSVFVWDVDGVLTQHKLRETFNLKENDTTYSHVTVDDHLNQKNCLLVKILIQAGYQVVFSSAYHNGESTVSLLKRIGELLQIEGLKQFAKLSKEEALQASLLLKGFDIFIRKGMPNVHVICARKEPGAYEKKHLSIDTLEQLSNHQFKDIVFVDDYGDNHKNFLLHGKKKHRRLYLYDENLKTKIKESGVSVNNILKASLPFLNRRYEKVQSQLDTLVAHLKKENIQHLIFPGTAPYFLFLCFTEIKRILKDPTCCSVLNLSSKKLFGLEQDTIDFIKNLSMISFAFSGKPGAPESGERYTKAGKERLFKCFIDAGLLSLSGKKVAILDTVSTGLGMRSLIHFLNSFYSYHNQKKPEIRVINLLTEEAQPRMCYFEKGGKIVFESKKLYGPDSQEPDEFIDPDTYLYKAIWFPHPFDNGGGKQYSSLSMYCKHWHEGPKDRRKYGEWFNQNFLPEYLAEVFSYEPSLFKTIKEFGQKVTAQIKGKL